ncbi:MAG TPA: GTPase domain-containing protein [Bacteroidia bacterium]|nr:GTPase domain-containing protein [Bacteroidia bacterium]HNU34663.1 GTPase domain-containing protein [Bacteroidia bacterium]
MISHNKKILVMGHASSGKTSLVNRFVNNRFSHGYTPDKQIKVDKKHLKIKSNDLRVVVWTAPGEIQKVKAFKSCYIGTDVILHTVDVNNPSTFADVDEWLKQYKRYMPATPVYIACNKIDANIELDATCYFKDIASYRLFFVSAKENFKVAEMFDAICHDLLNLNNNAKIKVY